MNNVDELVKEQDAYIQQITDAWSNGLQWSVSTAAPSRKQIDYCVLTDPSIIENDPLAGREVSRGCAVSVQEG